MAQGSCIPLPALVEKTPQIPEGTELFQYLVHNGKDISSAGQAGEFLQPKAPQGTRAEEATGLSPQVLSTDGTFFQVSTTLAA